MRFRVAGKQNDCRGWLGYSQSKSVQLSMLTTVSVTFQHGSGSQLQPVEDGNASLAQWEFLCSLSVSLPSSNSVLDPIREFFFSPWVDVFFFLSLGCWVGCFIIIFLILVKGKKVLFRACSKVAIFLMRSTRLPPT